MGQVLHGSATTTEAVRRAIQLRQESVRALAKRYGVSPTTVQKWRKRSTTADARMGPKEVRSTVLTREEEAIVVAFRRHTLLALDDCLYALQPTIPHLTRSSLHRCLERHGISRLPEMDGDKPKTKRFADYAIGYFHIDIAEVRTEEGKLYLFVAIDRTSKLAFAKLEKEANRHTASDFLRALVEAVPYQIHTVLTDNGIQFCHAPRNRSGPTARYSVHMFDRVCRESGIEHRLTKPNHPWTNGQVERMNRTLKDATVKRYHYQSHEQLRTHLQLFLDAYNHARRLKTLRGLTPYEHVLQVWTKQPERFRLNPSHHIPGPYTWSASPAVRRLCAPTKPQSNPRLGRSRYSRRGPPMRLASACLALVAFCPALAFAADLEVASRIDRVTVFPDAAVVTRLATVDLALGASSLVFRGLPASLDPASSRVEGAGSAAFSIGGMDVRATPGEARHVIDADLEQRLRGLREERETVQGRLA